MARKRANNEGSIYKRKDGRWTAALTLPNGVRKAFYGETRAEVAAKLAAAIRDRDRGLPLPAERETVGAFLNRWLNDVCKDGVRPNTFACYRTAISLHAVPRIGSIRLARLAPPDLARLYSELRVRGLSPRTVQLVHAVLHKAFSQALRWNLVARNPVDLIDPPRSERKELRVLTPEQCRALLEGSRDEPLSALYYLAVLGGLRSGELLGLQWKDVDWEDGAVHVRRQLTRVDRDGFQFSEPKTAKGRRAVTLPAIAMDALKQHRARQIEARLAAVFWEDNDLVFCNHIGRPLERQNVHRRSWKPLLHRLGLPDVRFHDLRHSAATLLLSLGEHPKVVQERLGHATIAITMDIYSHVMPTMQRDAAAKLDAHFSALPAGQITART